MEACGSAHHWAREAQSRGHRVVLVPPHAARPCVLRNKTDRTDAKGLLEGFRNDDVRPVPVKSETQQALAALHRLRATWVATRTARLDTLRGILREFGVVIPTGAHHVVPHVRALLEEADACCLTRVTAELTRGCAAHDIDGEPARTGARGKPTNPDGRSGRCHDWLPARDFHHGPERERSTQEAGDTTAV